MIRRTATMLRVQLELPLTNYFELEGLYFIYLLNGSAISATQSTDSLEPSVRIITKRGFVFEHEMFESKLV